MKFKNTHIETTIFSVFGETLLVGIYAPTAYGSGNRTSTTGHHSSSNRAKLQTINSIRVANASGPTHSGPHSSTGAPSTATNTNNTQYSFYSAAVAFSSNTKQCSIQSII